MDYSIGNARSIQIEWQYGLTALTNMVGLELPKNLYTQVIDDCADWSERFNTGRVRQIAMRSSITGLDNLEGNPHYVRPGRSLLDWAWTKERGTIREELIGHPTVLNQRCEVVQSEVYVDRWIRFVWVNPDWPDPRPELISDEFTHQVSETTDVELVPYCFDVPRYKQGNTLATLIGHQMHDDGYRPATLTEVIWYAAKYQNEIQDNQILVPWGGYSGGFSDGRQMGYHTGLPFVARHKGVLKLVMQEFLGQRMSVGRGVEYLAVKM